MKKIFKNLQNEAVRIMEDSAISTRDNQILNVRESKKWFEKQREHAGYVEYVGELKDYKNFKRDGWGAIVFGLLFMIPIRTLFFIGDVDVGTKDILTSIVLTSPFVLMGLHAILSGFMSIKGYLPNALPAEYVDKYTRTRKKSDKSTTTYYSILKINNTLLTVEVSRKTYYNLINGSVIWVIPLRKRKHYLWGIDDDRAYDKVELESLLSSRRIIDTPSKNKIKVNPIDISNAKELNALESLDWFKNKDLNDKTLINKIEKSQQYKEYRKSEFKNLVIVTFFFTLASVVLIFMMLSVFKSGESTTGGTSIASLFGFLSCFLIHKTLTFNKLEIEKAVEGVLIDIMFVKGNSNRSSYVAKILIEDIILQLDITSKIEFDTSVWIYKCPGITEDIKILKA